MRLSVQFPLAMAVLLLIATPGAAWHQEDERTTWEGGGAVAGDPRVLEDARECVEATEGSETHCIVLYAHLFEFPGDATMNLQRPPECAPDPVMTNPLLGAVGLSPWASAVTFETVPGHIHFFSPPSCQWHDTDQLPNVPPLRGQAAPVVIAPAGPITGFWHLSHKGPLPDDLDGIPVGSGVLPCVTVEMVLETSQGFRVARGETTRTVATGPEGLPPVPLEDPCPGSQGEIRFDNVTEFRVEATPVQTVIRSDEKLQLKVSWYQWDGVDGKQMVQEAWRVVGGEDHPNRIVLPVESEPRLDNVRLWHSKHRTWISMSVLSPWGYYDVDVANSRLTVVDETGDERTVSFGMSMSNHNPFNHRFMSYPISDGPLETGSHFLHFHAPNWQHTAAATWTGWLNVTETEIVLEHEGATVVMERRDLLSDLEVDPTEERTGTPRTSDPPRRGQGETASSPAVGVWLVVLVVLAAVARDRR